MNKIEETVNIDVCIVAAYWHDIRQLYCNEGQKNYLLDRNMVFLFQFLFNQYYLCRI